MCSLKEMGGQNVSWQIVEQVGITDLDSCLIQFNLNMGSVKPDEHEKLLVIHRLDQRSRSCPPLGPPR